MACDPTPDRFARDPSLSGEGESSERIDPCPLSISRAAVEIAEENRLVNIEYSVSLAVLSQG
jgi:hypothetical protein